MARTRRKGKGGGRKNNRRFKRGEKAVAEVIRPTDYNNLSVSTLDCDICLERNDHGEVSRCVSCNKYHCEHFKGHHVKILSGEMWCYICKHRHPCGIARSYNCQMVHMSMKQFIK